MWPCFRAIPLPTLFIGPAVPELPEVEVTRQGLLRHLPGCRIVAVRWSGKSLRRPLPRRELRRWITGSTILTVQRRAKYLLVSMEDGTVLVVHLGMSGTLGLFAVRAATAPHDHLCLELDNGLELRYHDARRFGMILVWPAPAADRLRVDFFARTGPEPFSDAFSSRHLRHLAGKRLRPVKNFLLDQGVVAGLGNIYVCEILFGAGLHPETPVNIIQEKQWRRVVTCCRRTLEAAIAGGGTTIADFVSSSGRPGYFQLSLNVYNRSGKPCKRCSAPIQKIVLAGRSTFFCPECQRKRGN